MGTSFNGPEGAPTIREGAATLHLFPSGGTKGPGRKSNLFYNPSMVQNRDISVLFLSALLESGSLPGKNDIRVLDGLCGSGIRSIRFFLEVGTRDGIVRYSGCDREEEAVKHARAAASENKAEVELIRDDLCSHLQGRKHSYIDVDPYGPPVQFIPSALSSLLSGGVLAVTATDTAALTGSAKRAASRRYWTEHTKTDFLHEMSCRVLLGYLARCASTLEKAIKPLFLYSSDHYVRAYVKVVKSASKADASIGSMGYLLMDPPSAPIVLPSLKELSIKGGGRSVIGPIWTGPLEDTIFVDGALRMLVSDKGPVAHLSNIRNIETLLRRGLDESGLPPGGYDLNSQASFLRTSPPPIEKVIGALKDMRYLASRSRFSHTLIKTNAPYIDFKNVFIGQSKGGGP